MPQGKAVWKDPSVQYIHFDGKNIDEVISFLNESEEPEIAWRAGSGLIVEIAGNQGSRYGKPGYFVVNNAGEIGFFNDIEFSRTFKI